MSQTYEDKPLRAFHGDAKIKEKYVSRVEAHIKADELIHGTGWDRETCRGCAVGCTLNKYDHTAYETELGLPTWLAQLEDTLFENMPREQSKTWPKDLLEAIPVGANLDKVYHRFAKYILTEISKDCDEEPVRKAIETVLSQHDKAIKGEITTLPWIWRAVSAAESAARSAAWSAAESAAWSAARSAAESAAESAAFSKMATKLLELLREAEVILE